MRDICKTLNFSYLPALIEEAQYRANRMENAIESYGSDMKYNEEHRIKLNAEIKELEKKKVLLKDSIDKQ